MLSGAGAGTSGILDERPEGIRGSPEGVSNPPNCVGNPSYHFGLNTFCIKQQATSESWWRCG